MDLDKQWGSMDWIFSGSRQGPLECSCEQGDEPPASIKYYEIF